MKLWIATAGMLCLASIAQAQDAEFYRGKTLTIACHTGPGGGYDTYVRVLSRHIGRHIPGNPNVIVINQPGAGGLLAINHAGKMAPRDGTFISLIGQGLMVHEPTGQPGLQVSLGDFNWIGNLAKSTFIAATWPRSRIKSLDDAKKQDVVMPSTGVGGTDSQLPAAYNALLGTRFKIVQGYDGGGQMNLSAERGETLDQSEERLSCGFAGRKVSRAYPDRHVEGTGIAGCAVASGSREGRSGQGASRAVSLNCGGAKQNNCSAAWGTCRTDRNPAPRAGGDDSRSCVPRGS
jgi:hypothetical protein